MEENPVAFLQQTAGTRCFEYRFTEKGFHWNNRANSAPGSSARMNASPTRNA